MALIASVAYGNNLSITNVVLVNVTNGTADIEFDVSWSNSWRYTEMTGGGMVTNHDAAWVFVKYRAGGDWGHVLLTEAGHAAAAGTEIVLGSSGAGTNVGVFVRRSSDGHGGTKGGGMRLHWDYVKGGLSGTNGLDISVHGTEMVYVPEGPFYAGAGAGGSGEFYVFPDESVPFRITNEAETTVGTSTGNLYYGSLDSSGDRVGPIPAAFPKGYAAFYCMKHEISQGQYAQFLNRVPSGTDWNRFPNSFGSHRHTIRLTNGVYVADAPDRACNYLSWADLATFLDWAGMRPMSELEFEKACRGPLTPVFGEFAWGDAGVEPASSISGTDGSGTETAHPVGANCHGRDGGAPPGGPIRVGIFARESTTRHQAGAGYYGALDLSGNVAERAVTVGNAGGRAFVPTHGDGDTQTANLGWPSVATAAGAGIRGWCWQYYGGPLEVSGRTRSAATDAARGNGYGGRGVRSAQ